MTDAFDYHTVPENSMGMAKGEHKFIKWDYFWQLFNEHSAWDLEGYNPATEEWVSCKSAMTITKTRSEDNTSEKIKMEFTAPATTDYRLTFAINAKVKDYIEKIDQYKYELNYKVGEYNGEDEIYSVFFDWSDIAAIPAIILSHGVTEIGGVDCFWFRARKNNVQKDAYIELDPTFGNEGGLALATYLHDDDTCYIKGLVAESGEKGGELVSISVYFYTQSVTNSFQCAIYEYTDHSNSYTNNLIAVTETKEVLDTDDGKWITFDFATGFDIDASTNYYLCARAATDNYGDNLIGGESGSDESFHKSDTSLLSFDDPLTDETGDTQPLLFYCTYTESAGTKPVKFIKSPGKYIKFNKVQGKSVKINT